MVLVEEPGWNTPRLSFASAPDPAFAFPSVIGLVFALRCTA